MKPRTIIGTSIHFSSCNERQSTEVDPRPAKAFTLAGFYALSASGNIRRLPLTRMAIIVIIVLYSLRALAGSWVCVADFFADAQHHVSWLQFFSSVIPAFIAWCYYPGLKKQ